MLKCPMWFTCKKVNISPVEIRLTRLIVDLWHLTLNFFGEIASSTRGQTAEARRTTILQPVERKPHSQKDRQNEKGEDYVLDEGTR